MRGLYCTEYDIHDLKLTEQALAAREEQLRLFTDNIPEPVVYLDDEPPLRVRQRVVPASERASTATTSSASTSAEVIGTGDYSALEPVIHDARVAGEAVTYEQTLVDAIGRTRWLRGRIVPDAKFDGTIKGLYVVGHDITDLKQAQDALAAREGQLRAIMDGVPAPVAYIDRDERCHYVNRTFLQFFGLTEEQVGEMRLRDVVGHGIYQSAQAMLTRALEGESTAFDRLVPGRERRAPLDDDPRRAGCRAVRRGARRVRADERHPRPEAGAGGVARVGGRAAAHHGQRAGARVVHRPRLPYRFLNRHNEEWLGESRKELTGRADRRGQSARSASRSCRRCSTAC